MTAQTILPANTLSSGYDVDNSLRFNDDSSDYLNRSVSSSGNRRTYTISTWFKRGNMGANQKLITAGTAGQEAGLQFYDGSTENTLRFYEYTGSDIITIAPNRLLRDPSAWYHVVIAVDTTQGTASNRVKYYLNGVQETSFATATYPDQNYDTKFNTSSVSNYIGFLDSHSAYYDGYLAETVLVDGQALDATSFGEFDSDSPNIWKPIDVSGLTFGTNGFYLQYKQSGTSQNSSGLGADTSGNDNHFAVNNLTAVDQTTDTCTNNFATINPLDNYWAGATLSEGNTKVSTGSSNEAMSTSTFAMTKGKWYMEADFISGAGARMCGITPTPSFQTSSHGKAGDVTPHTATYIGSGKVQEGNGSGGQTELADYNSYATGDIIGIYMDLDNFKAYFSKNGTLQSATGIDLDSLAANGTGHYMFFVGDNNSGSLVCEANFGNGFQSLSSAVADDNGYGAFEYSPNITGDSEAKKFYSCCTKNLAEFG